jgi:endonuclease/exonuclease/phosphatase (EEP) superfamily protein YafD
MAQITDAIPLQEKRQRLRWGVLIIPLLLAAATAVSFLGMQWWVFECLAHFRPHWAVLSLLVLLWSVVRRSPLAVVIAFACLVANVVPLAPYLLARSAAPDLARSVRVMNVNLHGDNSTLPKLKALIAKEQPDIVLLTEVPPGVPAVPMTLFPDYPETLFSQRGAFEVMVLSRWTIKGPHFDRTVAQHLPLLSAELCDPANPSVCLALIGLHGARPLGDSVHARDAQLRRAAQFAFARGDLPVLLMGDLNVTPWSPQFSQLTTDGELRDASLARGLSASWPSACLLCGVLIDHILVSPKITILGSRVVEDIGSDHRPVLADLALRP